MLIRDFKFAILLVTILEFLNKTSFDCVPVAGGPSPACYDAHVMMTVRVPSSS
jgi:hypothetical protein